MLHVSRGQFHQHFKSSFYTRRSQKRQKDSQVKQRFALLGSAGVKADCKHVDEIVSRSNLFHRELQESGNVGNFI